MNKHKQKIIEEFEDTFEYLEGAHRDHDGSTSKEEVQAFLSKALDEYVMSLLPERTKRFSERNLYAKTSEYHRGYDDCLDQIKNSL